MIFLVDFFFLCMILHSYVEKCMTLQRVHVLAGNPDQGRNVVGGMAHTLVHSRDQQWLKRKGVKKKKDKIR